jgi:hypothetical protein
MVLRGCYVLADNWSSALTGSTGATIAPVAPVSLVAAAPPVARANTCRVFGHVLVGATLTAE